MAQASYLTLHIPARTQLTNTHVSSGKLIDPSQTFIWDCRQGWHFDQYPKRPKWRHQLSQTGLQGHRNNKLTELCCFRLLGFGEILTKLNIVHNWRHFLVTILVCDHPLLKFLSIYFRNEHGVLQSVGSLEVVWWWIGHMFPEPWHGRKAPKTSVDRGALS